MSARQPGVLLHIGAVIWIATASPMAKPATDAVTTAGLQAAIFVSPVSAWEIGLLAARGRPGDPYFAPDPGTWFKRLAAAPPIRITPLTAQIAIGSSVLPGQPHPDPADRLLIATARRLGVPIVTRDRMIIAYAQAGHVAVWPC